MLSLPTPWNSVNHNISSVGHSSTNYSFLIDAESMKAQYYVPHCLFTIGNGIPYQVCSYPRTVCLFWGGLLGCMEFKYHNFSVQFQAGTSPPSTKVLQHMKVCEFLHDNRIGPDNRSFSCPDQRPELFPFHLCHLSGWFCL